ncbi:hypothetical protein [Cohnella sp.]|uniref:hypothetical protein n=1 Tax=Cohnella sp. TaxID=1883426 RepID=UPI00356720DD
MKILKGLTYIPFTMLSVVLIILCILLNSLHLTILKPYSLGEYLSEGLMYDAAYTLFTEQFLDKMQNAPESGQVTENEFLDILSESARTIITPEWIEEKIQEVERSVWDVLLRNSENIQPLEIPTLRTEVLNRVQERLQASDLPKEEQNRLFTEMDNRLPVALPLEGVYIEAERIQQMKARYDLIRHTQQTLWFITAMVFVAGLAITFYPKTLLRWTGLVLGAVSAVLFGVVFAVGRINPSERLESVIKFEKFKENIINMYGKFEQDVTRIWTVTGVILMAIALACFLASFYLNRFIQVQPFSRRTKSWFLTGRIALILLLLGTVSYITKEQVSEFKEHNGSPIYDPGNEGESSEPLNKPLKGVSLSPKSFQPDDISDFFNKIDKKVDAVMWAGDWTELGVKGAAPEVVATLSGQYGYTPIIAAQFFDSKGKVLRKLDENTRKTYRDLATDFTGKHKPKYLGLGIEVNTLYENSEEDFDIFVRLFDDVYDAIKAKSPDTVVFTVFQLEKMKGLHGGLFGGINNPDQPEWALLDRFTKADAVAFTTYPGIIYKDPSDIPTDYYSSIRQFTGDKPILFTEIGWHSSTLVKGWESSEAEQEQFIKTFFDRARDMNKEMAVWSFLYDPEHDEPFTSMGLFRRDNGQAKLGWEEWLSN